MWHAATRSGRLGLVLDAEASSVLLLPRASCQSSLITSKSAAMQRLLPCVVLVGLLAVLFARNSSAASATCSLSIQGSKSGNSSVISAASVSCAGGNVTMSLNETLFGEFIHSWSGVNMNTGEHMWLLCLLLHAVCCVVHVRLLALMHSMWRPPFFSAACMRQLPLI